jgi:hypothetical protein
MGFDMLYLVPENASVCKGGTDYGGLRLAVGSGDT